MQNINSMRIPLSMPSLEDGTSIEPESLSKGIHDYCEKRWDNRKHEWETHKTTLNSLKEKKKNSINNKVRKTEMLYKLECYIIWRGLGL